MAVIRTGKQTNVHKERDKMKTRCWVSFLLATVAGFGIQASAQTGGGVQYQIPATAQSPAQTREGFPTAGFHFPVGLTYSSGAYDVADKLLDAYEADWEAEYGVGIDTDRIIIPVGLTFNPYYEWKSGFGIGLDVGPTIFVAGSLEVSGGGYDDEDTKFSYVIPVGASVRYTFLRDRNVSPYVRAGVRYPIAGGDNIDSSQVGPFGAIGVEFWRNRAIGMALEVGYDGSEVTVEADNGSKDEVTCAAWTVSLSVLF
jgi:hypothetical protein